MNLGTTYSPELLFSFRSTNLVISKNCISTCGYTTEQIVTLIRSATHNAAKNASMKPMVVIIQRTTNFSGLDEGLIKYESRLSLWFIGLEKVEANQVPDAKNMNDSICKSDLL